MVKTSIRSILQAWYKHMCTSIYNNISNTNNSLSYCDIARAVTEPGMITILVKTIVNTNNNTSTFIFFCSHLL